jgi:RHS repeat-associated protein
MRFAPRRGSRPRPLRRTALLAALATVPLLTAGDQCPTSGPLAPASGAPEYQAPALVAVPGGWVHVAGGNLLVRRTDLSIDTRLGPHEVTAVYDGKAGAWLWSFDVSYDGATFVDEGATRHALGGLADGAPVPGTAWTRLDARRVATRGGLVYRFDVSSHRLLSITWRGSALPELRFVQEPDGAGGFRTDRVDQCTASGCALVYDLAYTGDGRRVSSIVDRAGRRARFAWDASGRLASARDPLDVARGWPGMRYAYDGPRLVSVTRSEGERVDFVWTAGSSNGPWRLTRVTQVGAGDPTWRFAYFAPSGGRYRTEMTSPLGHVSTWRYDDQRRLLEARNGAGDTTTLEWSGRRPTRVVGPDGVATELAWADDTLAQLVQPGGNRVRFTREPAGESREQPYATAWRRIEDDLGLVEARGYDAQGRLVSVTNGAGETATVAYDADSMPASLTDPDGIVTTFGGYGEHGHPTRVARGPAEHALAYDAVGNLVAGPDLEPGVAPGRGGVVARRFDEDRNLAALDLADLSTWTVATVETLVVEHRSDGQPLRVLRPSGGDTEWRYDALGRPIERRERADGQWHATRWTRDALGRVTALERPNGTGEQWSFDAADRVVSHRLVRGGATESAAGYAWSDGRLAWTYDGAAGGSESYAYDGAGRVREIVFPGGERAELGYDARQRLVQALLFTAEGQLLRGLALGYDAAGRETRVLDGGVLRVERHFENGRLARTRTGNGLERRFAYDAGLGALVGSTTTDAAGQVVESTGIESVGAQCGLAAHCVRATTQTFGALAATSEEGYWLMPAPLLQDPRSQSGKRVGSALVGGWPTTLDYDVLGNLVAGPPVHPDGRSRALLYNAERNRLERIEGGPDYAYDAAGFAVRRGQTTLSWDAAGRIAAVGEARFVWDDRGRLVESTVGGVEQRHLFGGLVAADAAGVPRSLDLGEVRIDLAGGGTVYRHFDFRGNPKLVSDAAGRVVEHHRYGPYGLDAALGAGADDRGFARGRALGDLVLLGSRVHDPAAARFLAPDPVYQIVGQYAYADGNPVQIWDPAGRAGFAVGVATAAAMYAGSEIGAMAGGASGTVIGGALGGLVAGPVGAGLGAGAGGFAGRWLGRIVFSQAAGLFVHQALTGTRGGRFHVLPGFSNGSGDASGSGLTAPEGFEQRMAEFELGKRLELEIGPEISPIPGLGTTEPGSEFLGGSTGCAPTAPVAAPDVRALGLLAGANAALALATWRVARRRRVR